MTANTNLLLANPDFDSIRGSLSNYLRSQSQFLDYDFDGSNLSVILDILAYNTYQNAFTSSMVASEMFLDTAQLKSSIISHAKELGYVPRSSRAAIAEVNIAIVPNDSPGTIVIPKGTEFNSAMGNRSFTFSTDRAYLLVPINGVYSVSNVPIVEGFKLTDTFVSSGSSTQSFIISNLDIDTNTLIVTVDDIEWRAATSILDVTSTSNVYFLQQNPTGTYQILFGDNVLGNQPPTSSTIQASYLVTAGPDANGATAFTSAATIAGYPVVNVTAVTVASGGALPEDTESIRHNAPQVYQTRGKAVVDTDYEILLKQQFPEIHAIHVHGGDTIEPPQYGRVFISISLGESLGVTQAKKTLYSNFISSKSPLTIIPVFEDPDFLFIKVVSTVYYDFVNYSIEDSDIIVAVSNAITAFNNASLNVFDYTLQLSHLTTLIDNSSPAILGNETKVIMVKPVNIMSSSATFQKISFYNPFEISELPIITSTLFTYNNQTCMLSDFNGDLVIVTNLQNSIRTIAATVGSVVYDQGIINISAFTPQYVYGGGINILVEAQTNNVYAKNNTIMSIDTSMLDINAVPMRP